MPLFNSKESDSSPINDEIIESTNNKQPQKSETPEDMMFSLDNNGTLIVKFTAAKSIRYTIKSMLRTFVCIIEDTDVFKVSYDLLRDLHNDENTKFSFDKKNKKFEVKFTIAKKKIVICRDIVEIEETDLSTVLEFVESDYLTKKDLLKQQEEEIKQLKKAFELVRQKDITNSLYMEADNQFHRNQKEKNNYYDDVSNDLFERIKGSTCYRLDSIISDNETDLTENDENFKEFVKGKIVAMFSVSEGILLIITNKCNVYKVTKDEENELRIITVYEGDFIMTVGFRDELENYTQTYKEYTHDIENVTNLISCWINARKAYIDYLMINVD